MKEQEPFLASVKREWQEDVVVLENILAETRAAASGAMIAAAPHRTLP